MYPGPKFCRQFSWGSDDPETEIGKRELLASESLDRAYREQYPADEQTESWLEDDMRDPLSRQDSTLDRRDSIEEIWNALQACPSAQAARSYSRKDYVPDEYYRRLEDGVYYKKNFAARLERTSSPCTNTSARFDHFFAHRTPRSSSLRVIHTTRSRRHRPFSPSRLTPRPSMPNYSLWLEPTTSTYAPCSKFILDVAHRHPEAPCFPPHVTLVGAFHASDDRSARSIFSGAARAFSSVDGGRRGPRIGLERVECGERRHRACTSGW